MDNLQNYKILSFKDGKPRMKKFYDNSEDQIRSEFDKLSEINTIVVPVAVLDRNNELVIWNDYFELEEVNKLINSIFKELI